MSYEACMHLGFAVTIVASLAWAWWKCRLTPDEEKELTRLVRPSILPLERRAS